MSLVPKREEVPHVVHRNRGSGHSPMVRSPRAGSPGFTGKDFLRILRKRKWMIIISLLVFTVAAGATAYIWLQIAPRYTAIARLEVHPEKSTIVGNARMGVNKDEMERLLSSQAQFISVTEVLEATAKNIRDTNWYEQVKQRDEDVVTQLKDSISVSVVPMTKYLQVSMSGTDRVSITKIVNEVAKAAVQISDDSANIGYQKTIDELRGEIKTIDDSREEKVAFLEQAESGGVGGKTIEAIETLRTRQQRLEQQVINVQAQWTQAAQSKGAIEGVADKDIAEMVEVRQQVELDPDVQGLEAQVNQFEMNLANARNNLGPGHKSVKQWETALKTAEAKLTKTRDEVTVRVVADTRGMRELSFQYAATQLNKVKGDIDANDTKLKRYLSKVTKLDEVKRALVEANRKRGAYEAKIDDLRLLKNSQRPLTVASSAREPVAPTFPSFKIFIPLGIFIGLVVGLGLALLLEFMDSSIKAPSDISRRIDLPLLGMVPHIDDVDEEIGDLRTAFLHHPDTIICEAFRQIRTTLMFHGPDAPKRSILIASAMPEDGRTTIALNLASHISSGGGKILVLDANFRQPAIHGLFPECPPGGLSNVLLGEGSWKDYIHPVSPQMYVMPSGPAPQHPTELLGSKKMSELLEELYEEFDQVIIDSAPCLVISDTVVLSTLVDGVVLVVLAGENTHGVVQRTRDILSRLGVHIYGAILNGVRVTAGGYLRKNYDTFYEYRDAERARPAAPVAAVEPDDENEILDGDVDDQNI